MARRFHRVRHHGGRALAGGKGSLVTVGAGAATGALSQYAVGAVPFLSSAWWAMPVALVLVGHFLKRKNPAIGGALLGIGGYWGYNSFMTRSSAKGLGEGDAGAFVDAGRLNYDQGVRTDASPQLDMAGSAAGFSAYSDAGELVDAGDAMGLQD